MPFRLMLRSMLALPMTKGFARAACLLLPLLLCVSVHAQFGAGVQGVVTDGSGAVIAEALVTLISNETNIPRTTKSGESGVFSIAGLAPGTYKVSVEKPGFTMKILNDVRVDAEQMRSLNVQLKVGQATESITVSESSVPLMDTEAATIGGTLTARDVENLPSMGRDPLQLMRLTPGAF